MISVRKAKDRGRSQMSWLDSWHTFSFDRYHDPRFMHFGDLRVINEDFVNPGAGFGRHPHQNMEIITYVVSGSLEHKDSLGTGSVIRPGEIQRMTAGRGVEHSEFNHSATERLHLLQIWIRPDTLSLAPSYEQKQIPREKNMLHLIGSSEGGNTSVAIHQDIKLYSAHMSEGSLLAYSMPESRQAWLQLIKGEVILNTATLESGDGAGIKDESTLSIKCSKEAEFLFFDLR